MDLDILTITVLSPWVLLALFAAFTDALVGFIDEWLLTSLDETDDNSKLDPPGKLILISGFFGIITAVIVYIASAYWHTPVDLWSKSIQLAFIAGILEVAWLIPYFHAIHRSGALDATPVLQSVPIFSAVYAFVLFGDIPTGIQVAGTLLVIAGAIALNYSKEFKKINFHTLSLMMLSSGIITVGLFVFKDAALEGTTLSAIFGNGLGMFFASLAIWISYKPYRVQFNQFVSTLKAKTLLAQTGNEGLYTLSAIAGQYALVLGPSVMIVSAFNAFHPFFTLLIASILSIFGVKAYQKRLNKTDIFYKIIGIISIILGAILLL